MRSTEIREHAMEHNRNNRRMQTCPVCMGRGTVPENFYSDDQAMFEYRPRKAKRIACKSCFGRGIVR